MPIAIPDGEYQGMKLRVGMTALPPVKNTKNSQKGFFRMCLRLSCFVTVTK